MSLSPQSNSSALSWERAVSTDHKSVLTLLHKTTDMFQKTLQTTAIVNKALKRVNCAAPFLGLPSALTFLSRVLLCRSVAQFRDIIENYP